MKTLIITLMLVALFGPATTLKAQDKQDDYLGLPGDNLNLYAVMKLFQESKTLEDFERNLNDEKTNINNLDLNDDNLVDYIKVMDNIDGDVHNIVLQVAVSQKENQDVAVFTVQRYDNGQVQIQLTGDEELYGRDYIIEPIFDDADPGGTPNPGYNGNTRIVNGVTVAYVRTTPVEIGAWPLVRFIYLPSYTGWHSSWYWGYYPTYWHPWRPFYWHYYYGYHYNWYHDYFGHYRRWNYHRYSRWNDFYYTGRRSYSHDVNHRIEVGTYKTTYSRPDQRKDGEAHFAKSHPDQYRRSTNYSPENSSNASRRSNSTMTNRNTANPSTGKNTSTTRRSTTTVTNRSVANPPADKKAVTSRRSSSTVKSATTPSSGKNTSLTRSTRQEKKTGVSSSSRKSSSKNKSATSSKKETGKKDSDKKESPRRR